MACFNCGVPEPNNEDFEVVCSDCCVIMCNTCKEDDDILCGCYGKCDSCNCDVDRGSDGWKCMDCQEWLCDDCKNESECSRCGRKVESSEDEERDSDSSIEENSIITDYLKSDEWVKYTYNIGELYHDKKEMIDKMKDKMIEIDKENIKIEEQIEQLEKQLMINKYLSENIFNNSILFEGNEDEIYKIIITYRNKYFDTNDDIVCNDKNVVENDLTTTI